MQPRHLRRRSRAGLALGTVGLVVAGALTAYAVDAGRSLPAPTRASPLGSPPLTAAAVPPGSGPAAEAAAALRGWDRARARAWARGSVTALSALYVEGAGRNDVRLLRDYQARGLRVEEMRTQLLAIEVLAHREDAWRVRVTDRLARAVAVGAGTREVLPRDQASTRTVRLVEVAGRWRVASVR